MFLILSQPPKLSMSCARCFSRAKKVSSEIRPDFFVTPVFVVFVSLYAKARVLSVPNLMRHMEYREDGLSWHL